MLPNKNLFNSYKVDQFPSSQLQALQLVCINKKSFSDFKFVCKQYSVLILFSQENVPPKKKYIIKYLGICLYMFILYSIYGVKV